jgi:hypothetical protein
MEGYTPGESGAFFVAGTVTDKNLELVKIRYEVSGVISKSNGGYAEGASVQLKQGVTDVGSPVSADEDGAYTIPGVLPGTYTIQVTLAGYQDGTITSFAVSGTTADKDLELQKYHALNGVISKSDGGFAEGASVQLRQAGNVGDPVIADEDGAYTIPNVIPGTYTIQVTLAGYDPGTITSFTVPAVTANDLTLQKTRHNVIGVISKANGGFAEGASVQLKLTGANEGNAVNAGSNGAYTIPNVYAGTYTIEASLLDYVTNESAEFTVPAVTTQNLTLQQTRYDVSGVISNPHGGFADGASVQLKQGASNVGAPVNADPSGAYTISDVTAGSYTIVVTLAGYGAGTSDPFAVTGGNSTGINLTLEKLKSISGVITKSDGGNAAGASVQLKQSSSNVGGEVIADSSGAYTIPNVTNGLYSIEVYLFGYQLGTDDVTVSNVDATKNLTLAKKTVDSSLTGTGVNYSEAAFEPENFTSALASESYTTTAANLEGVIPIRWGKVSSAQSYTVYYDRARKFSNAIPNPNSDDGFYYYGTDTIPANSIAIAPSLPARTAEVVSGITDNFYFARHLDGETTYYFWIQPVSASGEGPTSNVYTKYLAKKGRQNAGGIERADYPKSVNAIPGDQNILVTWEKSDRAVWYEVFYATTDVATSISFKDFAEAGTNNRLTPYKSNELTRNAGVIPWNQAWNDSTGTLGSAGAAGSGTTTAYPIYRFDATISGLTNGTSYYIYIRSLNSNGERGLAKLGPITPNVPLGAVTNLSATPAQRQLDLSWNALSGAGKYGIFWSTSANAPAFTEYHIETTATSYSLKGLDADTTYYVWVIGYNGTGNVIPGAFGTPVSGTTPQAPAGGVDNTKNDKFGHPVKNVLYVEVNDNDPRVAMGYVMEQSGKQFFDYVIIFAANLRTRDCEAEYLAGGANHICTQKGPHLHYNGNTQHILDNRDIYIKPLQDRGIKVLMGLLGDHDPIGMGTFQASPHSNFPQCDIPAREALAAQIAGEVNRYGLDGVDFDDEWTKTASGASAYNVTGNSGSNMLNFIINVRRLMPEKTISVFDYHMAKSIPASVTVWQKDGLYYTENPGNAGSSVSKTSHEFFDILTESIYGSWVASGSASTPNSKYAPVAINVDTMNPDWSTIASRMGTSSSYFMSTSKNGSSTSNNWYGFNLWYALRDRAWYQNSSKWGKASTPRTIEGYLSRASSLIYDENVIDVGVEYPQNWAKW